MQRAVYGDSGDGLGDWAGKIAWHERVQHGRLSAIRRGGGTMAAGLCALRRWRALKWAMGASFGAAALGRRF
jgi:hypothetical protein